ncbi:molybdenum cofactor guanylyltransferase [Xanthobacter sp. TB0139]|uniref:molybdenum cofactor guanylyltransferase n=1 Tax=Xanthobacter sp. TB0139 TaxID=3459178 RepID=UPI004039542C
MSDLALPFGLILAGGLGRRMAASHMPAPHGDGLATADAVADARSPATPVQTPKPLLRVGDLPLLGHVIACMEPQTSGLLISANADFDAYARFGLPLLADTVPGHPGPLAGVLSGLEWLSRVAPGAPLLSVPADTPFLPPDLAARLIARHATCGRPVSAESLDHTHHTVTLWPASAAEPLRNALKTGQLKVGAILRALEVVSERWEGSSGDPFFNVNCAADLAVARARITAL